MTSRTGSARPCTSTSPRWATRRAPPASVGRCGSTTSAGPAGARSAGSTPRARCWASPTATPAARASGGTRRSAGACAATGRRRWTDDYFELTELHVRPDAQGGGLGEGLLRALLAGTDRAHVLLSTPEHGPRPAGPGLAALPPAGLPRRAARSPVHRRRPPVRRARPPAAPPAPALTASRQPRRRAAPADDPPGDGRHRGLARRCRSARARRDAHAARRPRSGRGPRWHDGAVLRRPTPSSAASVRRALALALALLLASPR